MTTTPASPPFRRTRMFSLQFGLRSLLVLMLLVAGGVWWYIQPPKGALSDWQASRIKPAMTKSQVRSMIGEPMMMMTRTNPTELWCYRVAKGGDPKERLLLVNFDPKQNTVVKVEIIDAPDVAP